MTALEPRIADYLAHRMPEASDVQVDDLARIHGGSSQETFRFRARWRQAGRIEERRLILRRAPEAGLVNAERDLEFTVYSALAGSGVPIPAAHFLELDPQWLDRPFFIMDLVDGKPGHFFQSTDPYEGQSEAVGRNFWRHLGTLAAQDHRALGLDGLRNGDAEGDCWSGELDHWEAALDAGEEVIEPVVRGALRWLRRNPPPPAAKPAIVHGDYRCGNFLFLPDGQVSAVLDWEMCHVGDPLEDIAWALNPMWTMEKYFPLEEGLAIWEEASGLTIDRAALDWWRLFAPVKACGIWTTAEASFQEGTNREMIIALTAVRANSFHRREILDRMAQRGVMG
ncbi:phosphotransferase family protein [Novosphingobium sp. G106]|uniref:phosphotransferase family protein n=1 Tax=Novosphingobium sp. G106 TaxID=2849500 RepID=UPI001C2D806D|nr:phosphotransferase family protein [Novosphingobium sp. G106]MBV1687315.1 phosphotransferase family protein [Novosphingobium sp. G106]